MACAASHTDFKTRIHLTESTMITTTLARFSDVSTRPSVLSERHVADCTRLPRKSSGWRELGHSHRLATLLAKKRRPGLNKCQAVDSDFKKPLHANECLARITVQESIITRASKVCRQYMLNEQPYEVRFSDGTSTSFPTLPITIGEGHILSIIGNQLFITDHATVQVARERLQCRYTIADLATIDNPVIRQRLVLR